MTLATTAYLWLSVLVWLTALAQSVRFDQPAFMRVFQGCMALWPAGLLAGGAL